MVTFYAFNWAVVAIVAAVVGCVFFAIRPWLACMGWLPGRIHRAARRAEQHGLPVCGNCGHPVALWDEDVRLPANCGECGASYARCGVISRAAIARLEPGVATIAAIIAAPTSILALACYGVAYEAMTPAPTFTAPITTQPRPALVRRTAEFNLVPSRVEGESVFDTTLRSEFNDPPPFTLAYEVDVIGTGGTLGSSAINATDGRVNVALRGDGVPKLDLEFRPATDAWTLTAASAGQPPMTGIGADEAIAALYALGGLALRPWADAEMCEAADRLRTMTSSSAGVNGFIEAGHAGEAAHEHDKAMVAANRVGTGEGTSSIAAGATPFGWQGTTTPTPVPGYARPAALAAGVAPVLLAVAGLVVYARTRGRRLSAGSLSAPPSD